MGVDMYINGMIMIKREQKRFVKPLSNNLLCSQAMFCHVISLCDLALLSVTRLYDADWLEEMQTYTTFTALMQSYVSVL